MGSVERVRQGVWATHPCSSAAAVIINSGTMTAGEADVNSNIRFQSACTVPPLRNEEVLKPRCMTKPLKHEEKKDKTKKEKRKKKQSSSSTQCIAQYIFVSDDNAASLDAVIIANRYKLMSVQR